MRQRKAHGRLLPWELLHNELPKGARAVQGSSAVMLGRGCQPVGNRGLGWALMPASVAGESRVRMSDNRAWGSQALV